MGYYVSDNDVFKYMFIMFEPSDPITFVNQFRDWVNDRIDEAEIKLEEKCRTAWRTITTTETFRRNWSWHFIQGRLRMPLIPSYQPLKQVHTVEVDSGSGYQVLDSSQYVVRENAVYVNLRSFPAWSYFHVFRITYSYGYDSVPADVKGAIIRMVALEMLTTANVQTFLQKMPEQTTIENMKEFVKEVIVRYQNPQVLPR